MFVYELSGSGFESSCSHLYNFVSVILNVVTVGLVTAATAGLESGSASLLLICYGMPNVLHELLNCFNGTAISAFFVSLLTFNFPVILVL